MRKRMRVFGCALIITVCTGTVYAQTIVQASLKERSETTHQEDAMAIVKAAYHPVRISWWDSGNGIVCKHTTDDESRIIRYDKQGNYVETLRQKEWNDRSPLYSDFQNTQYSQLKVITYWEVSDANKKGYYLEMIDSGKRTSSVWVDSSGRFSTIPNP